MTEVSQMRVLSRIASKTLRYRESNINVHVRQLISDGVL